MVEVTEFNKRTSKHSMQLAATVEGVGKNAYEVTASAWDAAMKLAGESGEIVTFDQADRIEVRQWVTSDSGARRPLLFAGEFTVWIEQYIPEGGWPRE